MIFRPGAREVVRPGDTSEAGRAFRQRRVARFGLVAAQIGLAFLFVRIAIALAVGMPSVFFEPSTWFQALAVLAFLVPWWFGRRGQRTFDQIDRLEACGVLGGSLAYVLMGLFLPLELRPDLIAHFALSYTLFARSVYVPSTGTRTFIYGAAVFGPLVAMVFVVFLDLDPEPLSEVVPHILELAAWQRSLLFALAAGAWWGFTVFLCTSASIVIFGLRREVRDVKRLGQYTLRNKIGEGGMGVVYAADHAMLRRPTAIKLVPKARAGSEALARFEREVQLTARLTHPNTVRVYDFGRTPDGVFYYAMEFLDGATLAEIVAVDGPQPPGRVVHILAQVAGALAEAHEIGLIHRDIKPSNVMLLQQGGEPDVAKVLDFGLVQEIGDDEPAGSRSDAGGSAGADAKSLSGSVTGTPLYMPPEAIARPSLVGPPSDLYSLSAVGYFLVTGKHVFDERTASGLLDAHLHREPVRPSERLGSPVPACLEGLLLQGLAKDPGDRPPSARDFRLRLENLEGVVPYTDEDARGWWATHDEVVCPECRKHAPEGPVAATLAIDLAERG